MAKRRKGVTPPHLRPFLFKKGHAPLGKRARSAARSAVAAVRRVRRTARRAVTHTPRRHSSRGMEIGGARPRWLEMLLFGILGYEAGAVADEYGANGLTNSPNNLIKSFFNARPTGMTGGQWVGKVIGAAASVKAGYDYYKNGKLSSRDLNMLLPLGIGAISAPTGAGGSAPQGYW